MYKATTKKRERDSDFERSTQLKSMTLICTSKQTRKTLDVAKYKVAFCARRGSRESFERQFEDERQHAWMLASCFRSQGGEKQSEPKQF